MQRKLAASEITAAAWRRRRQYRQQRRNIHKRIAAIMASMYGESSVYGVMDIWRRVIMAKRGMALFAQ